MKKIFKIFCFLLIITLCLSVSTFAAENENDTGTTETEPEGNNTIFTRLWEFVNEYKGEVLTLIGDGALIILAVIMKLKNGKSKNEINAALDTIKNETGLSLSNQGNVVDVVNKMIESYNIQVEGYNKLREAYDKYGETELDRNRVIGVLAAEISTVLDILSTVYPNSKNLPQGVKDLVNIKYANCLKAFENDEALASIVNAVRMAIGNTDNSINETTEA